jgi:hypothetical protein
MKDKREKRRSIISKKSWENKVKKKVKEVIHMNQDKYNYLLIVAVVHLHHQVRVQDHQDQ